MNNHEPLSILRGCYIEAQRAAIVAVKLEGLRNALPESLHPHLNGLIFEIRCTVKHLHDIADKSQVHIAYAYVPQIVHYLNIILPCLSKTLRDITSYYEDTSHKKETRWRLMYHKMSGEHPGTGLPARFVMYNQFLNLLRLLLSQ